MTPRARLAAALLAALAAAPAAGYERTEADQTGLPLAWPVPAVSWWLNPARAASSPSCAATSAGDPLVEAVKASFAAWEQGCSDLRLVHAGLTDERRVRAAGLGGTGENLVVVRSGWCSDHPQASKDPCYADWSVDCGGIYGCFEDHASCPPGVRPCADRSVVALTTVTYDPETGRIVDADVEVNGWDGSPGALGAPNPSGWYFTCEKQTGWAQCAEYGAGSCFYLDLQNTVTHEVGHVLGLAHTTNASATMYSETKPGDVEMRTLSADDVAGVCAIYPRADGGCGCGAGGAPGLLALAAAAAALRPRRRRRRPPAG